jgi:hypothetical protein
MLVCGINMPIFQFHAWLTPKLSLTHPLMSRFCTSMVQDWHWSIQDLPLLLWPTSKVEHLSLIKSFGVGFITLTPLATRKFPFHYAIKPQQKQHLPYQWLDVLKVLKTWL